MEDADFILLEPQEVEKIGDRLRDSTPNLTQDDKKIINDVIVQEKNEYADRRVQYNEVADSVVQEEGPSS